MKWVATREEMPEIGRRVLCAMYADTEYGFPVCGFLMGNIGLSTMYSSLSTRSGYSTGHR